MTNTDFNQNQNDAEFMPSVDAVSAIARFVGIVRRRKQVVITAIVIHVLLGMTYYMMATSKYASTAELLIIQQKQDHLATVGDHESSEDTMATNQKLISSPIVLQNAIKQLPQQHLIDLVGEPTHKWVETLSKESECPRHPEDKFYRRHLSLKTPRGSGSGRAGDHQFLFAIRPRQAPWHCRRRTPQPLAEGG